MLILETRKWFLPQKTCRGTTIKVGALLKSSLTNNLRIQLGLMYPFPCGPH